MSAVAAAKQPIKLDPRTFFSTTDGGGRMVVVPKRRAIFTQGNLSDAVFYIYRGKVKLNVVSKIGKEATIAILNENDFFGEGCLASQSLRQYSATAITDCLVMRIDKQAMTAVLHRERDFADIFLAGLLARNMRYEADLMDQLFNSSEKRLARLLLMLAEVGSKDGPGAVFPRISQGTMAEMVGTTRARVNFFMNRFRASGFVSYDGQSRLHIHSSRLSTLLHD